MGDRHIFPFVWMRGEEETVIRKELEKISETGIRSVCLEARPHPEYAGEKWWHDVDIVIDEAKKRDLTVWILDDAHFPTGMANDSMKKHPEKVRRFLYTNFVDITGPIPSAQVDVDLLMTKQFTWMDFGKPVVKPLYDENILLSVTAAKICGGDVTEGEILDLTDRVKDGYLTADIPAGTWRINVNFSTTAIGPKPEYINYIEADSVKILIDEVYEKHFERYGGLFGTVIEGFFSDEPGFYNRDSYDEHSRLGQIMALPWGREMQELLGKLYRGNLIKDLPYLFADDAHGAHIALRYAYMDAVSRLYSKNFCCQLGDWCRAHGVRYIGHIVEDNCGYMRLGAGVGHYFRAMAGQDMAGIDNIGYQLMPCNDVANRHTGAQDIKPDFYHYGIGRLGASCAAIDPLKKGRLMCENFGAYGWRLGVRDQKWLADYLIGQGVNYFVPHAFSMAEYPDDDCPPHFYARGNNPEFPYFCDLMKYTDRLCNMFSDGEGIAQAAVLFEAEADWCGETMLGSTVGKELSTHQIDYYFIPADVFANKEYYGCEVKNGELVVNGKHMKVLVIPECEYLSVNAAEFIAANPDLKVIFLERVPAGIGGPCDNGDHLLMKVLKGRSCIHLRDLGSTLRGMGVVDDLLIGKTDRNLRQYHYRKGERDYWFLMNTSSSETAGGFFRLPYTGDYGFYDAMTDRTVSAGVIDALVQIELKPYESVVLLTDPENAGDPEPSYKLSGSVGLSDFMLSLKKIGTEEPEEVGAFDLKPVSLLDRDFSGEMIYRTNFTLEEIPKKAVFSAQYVFECMTVEINGETAASTFTPPYACDITKFVREGVNELKVSVVSTALRDANTKPGIFGKERTVLEPTGMFGEVRVDLYA